MTRRMFFTLLALASTWRAAWAQGKPISRSIWLPLSTDIFELEVDGGPAPPSGVYVKPGVYVSPGVYQ